MPIYIPGDAFRIQDSVGLAAGLWPPQIIKPAVVRWVMPGWFIYTTSTFLTTAARIYYTPIYVSETTTYIRIGLEVTTGVAGTADLRIFNWTNGLPSSLVLSAGTVDTTAAALVEIVIAQQLTRGYYFLAYRCSAAPTLRVVVGCSAPCSSLNLTGSPTTSQITMYVDAAYADPAPAPTNTLGTGTQAVMLREN